MVRHAFVATALAGAIFAAPHRTCTPYVVRGFSPARAAEHDHAYTAYVVRGFSLALGAQHDHAYTAYVVRGFSLALGAQHDHGGMIVPRTVRERAITLRTGIGVVHEAIATASKDAQAFYDQGLAFLHGYAWIDAERSFRQALKADPTIAMAHLALSYTGWELQGEADARAAVRAASALATAARDRRRVILRELQLDAIVAPGDAAKRAAYIRALDDTVASNGSDAELLLLRGMAEDPDPAGRGMGSPAAAVPFYERALAIVPDHPGAHHYLTHAYEHGAMLRKALEHGAAYARLAPRVPHARHMYGHNLRRVGRIDEAIEQFRAAYLIETDPDRIREVPPEYDWHHLHNLDLLATSCQYVGQMKVAEPLLRRSFEIASPFVIQQFNKHEWPVFLLARGRAEEALAAARTLVAKPAPLVQAIGHVMEGRALLALGRYQPAAEASNAALRALNRAGPEASLAAADLKALQAEFFLRTGERAKARPLVEDAVRRLRARAGPDGWSQALFRLEALTRAAMAAGDWDLAGVLADQMRMHDPAYGGTHYAAALVAASRNDRAAERRELEAAKKAWSRADPDLPELAEIAARLRRGGSRR